MFPIRKQAVYGRARGTGRSQRGQGWAPLRAQNHDRAKMPPAMPPQSRTLHLILHSSKLLLRLDLRFVDAQFGATTGAYSLRAQALSAVTSRRSPLFRATG